MSGDGVELKQSHAARDAAIADGSDHELAARRGNTHLVTGRDAELAHLLRGKAKLLGPGQGGKRTCRLDEGPVVVQPAADHEPEGALVNRRERAGARPVAWGKANKTGPAIADRH